MRDVMTSSALRELYHDAFRMGRAVAVLADRDLSVFFLVAERAIQCFVFGRAGAEKFEGLRVARAAILRRHVRCIGYQFRHMRFVALLTSADHFVGVRHMAPAAIRDLAVDVMTHGAVKCCMLALIGRELLDLVRVAVQTRILAFE
jgi:hypothetical protein